MPTKKYDKILGKYRESDEGGVAVSWGDISGTLADQTDLQTALSGYGVLANPLSQFAATTSLQLAGVISDETGSGALVFGTAPTFTTNISTPLIIGAEAVGITPASGSNLNITLATTGDLVVNTNQLYVDTSTGFVGIGTTAPGAKLEVSGSDGTEFAALKLLNTNSVANQLVTLNFNNYNLTTGAIKSKLNTGAAGGELSFWTHTGGALTQKVTIDKTGNVGIGTTSPVSLLDVSSATGGITTLRRADTSVTANDMVGKIQFYAADTSTTTNFIVADIEAQATNTIATDINPGRLIFRTTSTTVAATPTERLRIDEAGDFTIWDTGDFILGSTTGTKFGTATTQKLAFYNATPIVQPSAYTQTYSTASKTVANPTAATLTDNSGGTADTTLAAVEATYTQATIRNNFADLAAMVNKLTADQLADKKVITQLIDDLQSLGLVA